MKVSFCLSFLLLFTVSTHAQPWITPGSRTNKIMGPVWIQGGGLTVDGNITTGTGTLSAAYFVGDGSLLTGVSGGGGGLSKYDPGVFTTNGTTIYIKGAARVTNWLMNTYAIYDATTAAGFKTEVDINQWQMYDLFNLGTVVMKYTIANSDVTFPAKVIAGSFSGDGSLLTGISGGSGINPANGKGTNTTLVRATVGVSNGAPNMVLYADGSTNVVTSGIGITTGSNIYGLGSYTGATMYVKQIFGGISASNTTASRVLASGADNAITNTSLPLQDANQLLSSFQATSNGFILSSNGLMQLSNLVTAINTALAASSNAMLSASNLMLKSQGGSGTNNKLAAATIVVSNASPSTLAGIDSGTNLTSSSLNLSSQTNIYGAGDYTGATIRVKQIFSSLNASNATASKLAYIGADQGVTNTGVAVLNGTNVNGVGSFQAAGSVTGANFFGVNQGVGASLTLYETSATHGVTLSVPNIVRSNLNIQFGSNGMRGNFTGIPVWTNLDSTGTNIEVAVRALSGVTDDGITLTFGGGGAISTAGGSGTNNKLATATLGLSNGTPSTLAFVNSSTNLASSTITHTDGTNLAGIGGISMGGGFTNVGTGSNFIGPTLQIGTNLTDLLIFGGVGSSNGLIRMQGADLPKFEFLTGNTNVSAPITYAHTSSNKLGVYNINQWESGTTFHNRGASVGMTNELPPGPTNGIWFKFLVATNKNLWIHGSNAFIRMGTIGSTTNNGYINSALQGSYIWLEAISSNEWFATSISTTNGAAATTNYTWSVQ